MKSRKVSKPARPHRRGDGDIYRRIFVRMWGDAEFRALSGPQPNAKDLWIYLLTGVHTGPIPGLFSTTRADLAERLKWPMEGFLKALSELLPEPSGAHGANGARKAWFKADWDAPVIWIRGSLTYNEPANPNVVKSWDAHWKLIPECNLKDEAYQELADYMQNRGNPFLDAFRKACGNRSANHSANGSRNQEAGSRKQEDLSSLRSERGGFSPGPSDSGFDEPGRFERSRQLAADSMGMSLAVGKAADELDTEAPSLTHTHLRQAAERAAGFARRRGIPSDEAALAMARAALREARRRGTPGNFGFILVGVDPWAPAGAQAPSRPGRLPKTHGTGAEDFEDVPDLDEQLRGHGLLGDKS